MGMGAECMPSCEKKEDSKAVGIVFDMVRDLMRKIRDVDGIEKQQAMAMQLFMFLGQAKDLEEIATKLMALAMKADKKESEEDKSEDTVLDELYID